ncbi:hypothetical protein L211DRAFT_848987 [Terfezia boudieri ATCC MYA-4762]|uniref:Uncharacterized protein n=1 Tax=Terfezia boudieri ATCC MYA-4762 TaxID=1051890 RepID=A0A3N4LMU8_9PEZI|nr:hypothetical protein L211DRAFT_848987 [Terfezia boudieri ATCC MYA-4762]
MATPEARNTANGDHPDPDPRPRAARWVAINDVEPGFVPYLPAFPSPELPVPDILVPEFQDPDILAFRIIQHLTLKSMRRLKEPSLRLLMPELREWPFDNLLQLWRLSIIDWWRQFMIYLINRRREESNMLPLDPRDYSYLNSIDPNNLPEELVD